MMVDRYSRHSLDTWEANLSPSLVCMWCMSLLYHSIPSDVNSIFCAILYSRCGVSSCIGAEKSRKKVGAVPKSSIPIKEVSIRHGD